MRVSIEQIKDILKTYYNIEGQIYALPGDRDLNFRVVGDVKGILKIYAPDNELEYLDFQEKLLIHLQGKEYPEIILTNEGAYTLELEIEGRTQRVRLLSWIEGALWNKRKHRDLLLYQSLGKALGTITKDLSGFSHPYGSRPFNWDIDQAEWCSDFLYLFSEIEKEAILYFFKDYAAIKNKLNGVRKSVVHNDGNDFNILVNGRTVKALIDFGDAIHTSIVNDLAIAISYAAMDCPDPLTAASQVLKGYHETIPFTAEEVDLLYDLVAIRLVLSLTNSTINKKNDPSNTYHQISAKPAWELLHKWKEIPRNLAKYCFRAVCGFPIRPKNKDIIGYLMQSKIDIGSLIKLDKNGVGRYVDLSFNSDLLGLPEEYNDPGFLEWQINSNVKENKTDVAYGGYLECRPFYITEAFMSEGIEGRKQRSVHLGIDFWTEQGSEIYTPLDGKILILKNNNLRKDYGPTIVLEHATDKHSKFYTLYGHLGKECLTRLSVGQEMKKGSLLAYVGNVSENGGWTPHLHFQIITDMLGNLDNYPGVADPDNLNVWRELCLDPHLLIDLPEYKQHNYKEALDKVWSERKELQGPSLSLSYEQPLYIVNGEKEFLIDYNGQRYLDLVNNVCHVGHEHPHVVKSARIQIAKLNTNTRYLHPNINKYAKALLEKFPKQLSKVYFVNSGSEANELALRMARTITGGKIMAAIESGYHGNTNSTIAVSSYKFNGKGGEGKPSSTRLLPMPDGLRGVVQGSLEEIGLAYARYIDGLLEEVEAEGDQIAGFISETILSCGGQIVLPDGYLDYVYKAVRAKGGVCICDEVQTGFGRVGKEFWAFQMQDVIPDIVTLGKPIGNGHPIGAVVCTEEVANKFNNGMEFFSTYGGNPVSCKIGLSVLEVIEKESLQENAKVNGAYFKSLLNELKDKFSIIAEVRGQGLFLGIEFLKKGKPDAFSASEIVRMMRNKKVLLSTDGPDHNVIKIKPPMCISEESINMAIFHLENALASL